MTRFEKLKNEATLEEMAEVMMILSVKIAKRLVAEEYGELLEISNFDKVDIQQFYEEWLKYELKGKQKK